VEVPDDNHAILLGRVHDVTLTDGTSMAYYDSTFHDLRA
jgi:hypothetical protein